MALTPFTSHRGVLAALDRANIDTDQIIPKQFLKSIARTGFGPHLFHDWRYQADGAPDPAFPLNAPRFRDASILVARTNFGCGSSREHAVWALQQAGFHAVVAPSEDRAGVRMPAFADIFRTNALKNGLLTVELASAEVEELFRLIDRYPRLEATVDLERQRLTVHLPEEVAFAFPIDPGVKTRLIHGLDDIGLTLQHEAAIRAFEERHDPQWSQERQERGQTPSKGV